MATLINLTDINISIVGTHDDGTQYRHRLPPSLPGSRRSECTLPDLDAKHWTKRTKWLKTGSVMLKVAPSTTTVGPQTEPATEVSVTSELSELHWKTAVTAVADCDDLDALAAMHETEERPRVKEAIESRMEELRA